MSFSNHAKVASTAFLLATASIGVAPAQAAGLVPPAAPGVAVAPGAGAAGGGIALGGLAGSGVVLGAVAIGVAAAFLAIDDDNSTATSGTNGTR